MKPNEDHDFRPDREGMAEIMYHYQHGAYSVRYGAFVRFAGSYRSVTGEPITALNPPCPVGFLD